MPWYDWVAMTKGPAFIHRGVDKLGLKRHSLELID